MFIVVDFLKPYCFIIFAVLLLAGCGNENSSAANDGEPGSGGISLEDDTALSYSDSILISDRPGDTVELTEDEDDNEEFALPEDKNFNQFYNKVAEAFENGSYEDINRFIHPKWGIYIIDRPGAIDKVDTGKNIQSFYRKIYLGDKRLKGMECKLQHRPIPEINCDKVYKGCVTEKKENFHRLTDLKKGLLEYGFKENYLPRDDNRLKDFEKLVKRNIVNFDKAIGISFLYIDNNWYIGVIDLAKYSCSA